METQTDKPDLLLNVQNTIYKAVLQLKDIETDDKGEKQDYRLMALNLMDVWTWIDNKREFNIGE